MRHEIEPREGYCYKLDCTDEVCRCWHDKKLLKAHVNMLYEQCIKAGSDLDVINFVKTINKHRQYGKLKNNNKKEGVVKKAKVSSEGRKGTSFYTRHEDETED